MFSNSSHPHSRRIVRPDFWNLHCIKDAAFVWALKEKIAMAKDWRTWQAHGFREVFRFHGAILAASFSPVIYSRAGPGSKAAQENKVHANIC